jgi:hypothetical protein
MPLCSIRENCKNSLRKTNIEICNNQLKNEICEDVYLQTDVNRAYSSFLTKYQKYFVNMFPLKKVPNNKGNKPG